MMRDKRAYDCLTEISLKISRLIGLHFPDNRLKDLERGVLSTAKELRLDENIYKMNDWLTELLSGSGSSENDMKVLTSHLTIGETYFFREKPALDFFQKIVIPDIIKRRHGSNRHIRVWSAGCSSGEEPYTIAIILREIIPDIINWRITILATDVSLQSLQKGTEGIYTPWSFREVNKEITEKYFIRSGNNREIKPEIKKMVTFAYLNLAGDSYPSIANNTQDMDVIFCRNVLMYFTPDKIRETGRRFFRALDEKGWLITSQVELNDEYFSPFSRVRFDKGIFYGKKKSCEHKSASVKSISVTASSKSSSVSKFKRIKPPLKKDKVPEHGIHNESSAKQKHSVPNNESTELFINPEILFESGKYRACVDECLRLVEVDANNSHILKLIVKSYANMGKLSEARKWGEILISRKDAQGISSAETYYLYATILIEQNELNLAEEAIKKALYIDPNHLFAHLTMGNLMNTGGKNQRAGKHFQIVCDLLEVYRDDELVPGSDGLTAGRLKEMVESLI
jgi:chemotaxis protein methyltransferase CheR